MMFILLIICVGVILFAAWVREILVAIRGEQRRAYRRLQATLDLLQEADR